MNKITANVYKVKKPEDIETQKGTFTKQEVILMVDGKYPNYIPIEVTGDSVGEIARADEGRKVEVGFFINGRMGTGKYEGRCFVSLRYAEHSFVESESAEPEGEDFDW